MGDGKELLVVVVAAASGWHDERYGKWREITALVLAVPLDLWIFS